MRPLFHYIFILLFALNVAGCVTKVSQTASGEKVLLALPADLYRKEPYILPAGGGGIALTSEKLIWFPSNGFPGLIKFYVYGKDSTKIKLENIDHFEKKQGLGILPNRLHVIMKDGKRYRFVTWKREKLIQAVQKIKDDKE